MMPWHLLTRGHEVCVLQRWQNEGGKWSRWVPRMQRSRLPCSLISYPFGSAHNIREQTWHWSWGSSGFSFRVYSDSLHLSRRANTLQEVCWFWILQAVVADPQLADVLYSFTSERWTLYRYITPLFSVSKYMSRQSRRDELEGKLIYSLLILSVAVHWWWDDALLLCC